MGKELGEVKEEEEGRSGEEGRVCDGWDVDLVCAPGLD
jgi:hypothetical protein